MSRTYQTVIEKYDRNGLFLNVVRASEKRPMSFLTIPSITGSGSAAESAGVSASVVSAVPGTTGGFFSAGTGSYYAPTIGISLSRGFTFTQSSLDNAAFQKSFMSEIPLAAINSMANSTEDRRELIYSMVIDSLVMVEPDGVPKTYRNNPLADDFDEFQSQLHKLIALGLSSELLESKAPIGTPMTAAQVNDIMFKYLDAKDEKQLTMSEIVSKGGKEKLYQIYQTVKTARFCFSKDANPEAVKSMFGSKWFCQQVLDNDSSDPTIAAVDNGSKRKEFELGIKLRSTGGVFFYLGNIVKAQTKANPKVVMLWNYDLQAKPTGEGPQQNVPMLVVKKNQKINGKVFAEIDYEGDFYVIPIEDAGYSSQTMSMLYAFVAMNKVPGAIPASPAVLIK